jgi:integrase
MRTLGRRGGGRVPDPMIPVYRAYVALGCYSGLRSPGEMTGLDVQHVDFARQLVHVVQVVTRKDGLRPYPKTESSRRWVPFGDEVAELLWPLIADRTSGPVFMAERGGRINEANFRNRVWRPALEAAGVEYIDPYSMRHTCASWLRQDGMPDAAIAQILGHSSTRMLGVYAHHDPLAFDRVRDAWARWRAEAADALNAGGTHGEKQKAPSPGGLGA